jgi:hypothetical protein
VAVFSCVRFSSNFIAFDILCLQILCIFPFVTWNYLYHSRCFRWGIHNISRCFLFDIYPASASIFVVFSLRHLFRVGIQMCFFSLGNSDIYFSSMSPFIGNQYILIGHVSSFSSRIIFSRCSIYHFLNVPISRILSITIHILTLFAASNSSSSVSVELIFPFAALFFF